MSQFSSTFTETHSSSFVSAFDSASASTSVSASHSTKSLWFGKALWRGRVILSLGCSTIAGWRMNVGRVGTGSTCTYGICADWFGGGRSTLAGEGGKGLKGSLELLSLWCEQYYTTLSTAGFEGRASGSPIRGYEYHPRYLIVAYRISSPSFTVC